MNNEMYIKLGEVLARIMPGTVVVVKDGILTVKSPHYNAYTIQPILLNASTPTGGWEVIYDGTQTQFSDLDEAFRAVMVNMVVIALDDAKNEYIASQKPRASKAVMCPVCLNMVLPEEMASLAKCVQCTIQEEQAQNG